MGIEGFLLGGRELAVQGFDHHLFRLAATNHGNLHPGGAGRPELFLQFPDGAEEIALDRADGEVQGFGDLLEPQLIVMAEEEHGLFLGRNTVQGPGDPCLELGGLNGAARVSRGCDHAGNISPWTRLSRTSSPAGR